MWSRVIPLEYLKERDIMFWLPPGGQDNEVWADTWVILADLEPADAEPILAALRDADVGAYVATPSGRRGAPAAGVQLYVDREQHNRATDVVMAFLRGKNRPEVTAQRRVTSSAAPKVRPRAVRILVGALEVAFCVGLVALGMLWAYYRGAQIFEGVHSAHHPTPSSHAPAITKPTWTDPGP
jgi:hypothetical protein